MYRPCRRRCLLTACKPSLPAICILRVLGMLDHSRLQRGFARKRAGFPVVHRLSEGGCSLLECLSHSRSPPLLEWEHALYTPPVATTD